MSSKRKYFSGATVSQAVLKAARQFGLDPDDVAWSDVDKKTGFVRGRRKVVIAVDPAAPKREVVEPEAPQEEVAPIVEDQVVPDIEKESSEQNLEQEEVEEVAAKSEVETEEVGDEEPRAARTVELPEIPELDEAPPLEPVDAEREDVVWDCLEPLLRLADLEIEAEIGERNDELVVELIGPDSGRVIERQGEVLDALGQLLPRLLSSALGERASCRIDCEGFWYKREMELCRTAFQEARRAIEEDRSRSLAPMNPRERRIVHQAIADVEGVTTESRGDGRRKRVVIRPI